jgi:hypothetical protein
MPGEGAQARAVKSKSAFVRAYNGAMGPPAPSSFCAENGREQALFREIDLPLDIKYFSM